MAEEVMPRRLIPLKNKGKGQFAIVDGDYDGEYLSEYSWELSPTGYVICRIYEAVLNEKTGEKIKGEMITYYLHRMASGSPGDMWVRCKNGNKLDCRTANLEWMTPSKSALIRKQRREPMSGYHGVVLHHTNERVAWIAKLAGRHLGMFESKEEAARVYDAAAISKYGKYARTNFYYPGIENPNVKKAVA